MKKSLTFNFIMNLLLNVTNLLFALITFPYLSRILQADGMGRTAFAISIIDYVSSLSLLGIPYYGVKACVDVVDNEQKLVKRIKELQLIGFISSILSLSLLVVLVGVNSQLNGYIIELSILSLSIPLKLIGIEYYFKAAEKFTYITIRSLIVRVIGLVFLFLFVKNKADLHIYLWLTVFINYGSGIFNYIYLKKALPHVRDVNLNLKQHIKPIFSYFFISIGWIIMSNTDTIMLGYLTNEQQIGYYSATIRIKTIVIIIVNALIQVLLPRMIKLLNKNQNEYSKSFIQFSFSVAIYLSLYFTGYIFLSSQSIILLLSGESFKSAIPILQMIALSFIPITVSTLLYNVLMATERQHLFQKAFFTGIALNIVLNVIFIPILQSMGAALSTVISEGIILIILLVYMKKEWKGYFNFYNISKIVAIFLLSIGSLALFNHIVRIDYIFLTILCSGLLYSVCFFMYALPLREDVVRYILNKWMKLFHRKRG